MFLSEELLEFPNYVKKEIISLLKIYVRKYESQFPVWLSVLLGQTVLLVFLGRSFLPTKKIDKSKLNAFVILLFDSLNEVLDRCWHMLSDILFKRYQQNSQNN